MTGNLVMTQENSNRCWNPYANTTASNPPSRVNLDLLGSLANQRLEEGVMMNNKSHNNNKNHKTPGAPPVKTSPYPLLIASHNSTQHHMKVAGNNSGLPTGPPHPPTNVHADPSRKGTHHDTVLAPKMFPTHRSELGGQYPYYQQGASTTHTPSNRAYPPPYAHHHPPYHFPYHRPPPLYYCPRPPPPGKRPAFGGAEPPSKRPRLPDDSPPKNAGPPGGETNQIATTNFVDRDVDVPSGPGKDSANCVGKEVIPSLEPLHATTSSTKGNSDHKQNANQGKGNNATKKNKPKMCKGIQNEALQETLSNPSLLHPNELAKLLKKYNVVNGKWKHKKCDGTTTNDSSSCKSCKLARPSVQHISSTVADLMPSLVTVTRHAERAVKECSNVANFLESEEAKLIVASLPLVAAQDKVLTLNIDCAKHHLLACSDCGAPFVRKVVEQTVKVCRRCSEPKTKRSLREKPSTWWWDKTLRTETQLRF